LPIHENGTVVFTTSLFKLHSTDSLCLVWFLLGLSIEDQSSWDVTLCYVNSSLCFIGTTELYSVGNSVLNDTM